MNVVEHLESDSSEFGDQFGSPVVNKALKDVRKARKLMARK
jgi:hypothetical protein